MSSADSTLVQLHEAVTLGEIGVDLFEGLIGNPAHVHECEILDFKQQLPNGDFEYAKTVRDIVALHNSYGGFVVFGVREVERDRAFEIVGVTPNGLQIAKLRDNARAYTGVDLRLKPIGLKVGVFNLEVIWVAKRGLGEAPVRFLRNGPEEKPGALIFKKSEVVFRRIENNAVAKQAEDYDFLFSNRQPPSLELNAKDIGNIQPLDHNLPDRALICSKFVGRGTDLGDLWTWLADDFSRVRLVAGEGGLGKTSLAYRFSEEIASRHVYPFNMVVWLTAKERQFIPSEDGYREASQIDFFDADSLFRSISVSLGCIESDFDGLDTKGLMQLALESCTAHPCFLVIDDVDSLSPEDQRRALEFGMRTPSGTKILLTTRVNFSYSPDNVLKLNGLPDDDFRDYVNVLRSRYTLPSVKDSKIEYLREVTGGSPLFADSLIRLERRGLPLDQAIAQWKGEKGIEARKAALQREVQQLSKAAKRVLFVISTLRSCSYVELTQIVDYTDQTIGDALQELSGLFLISAPAISNEARYSVEPNTGSLVLSLASTLGIDHAALISATNRARSDAIGLGIQKRSNIVGLAISQAMAFLKANDAKSALETVVAASKKQRKPHPDLLLAIGRFSIKLSPPNYAEASKAFEQSYTLGQRKPLLFDLWFEAEYSRGALEPALLVATTAIEDATLDQFQWYERRAQVRVALAQRARSRFSSDAAVREVDYATNDLRSAKEASVGAIQMRRIEYLIEQAVSLRAQLASVK
jgi:hypothetical protein